MANRSLPKLNPLKARSTVAALVTVGTIIAPQVFDGLSPEDAADGAANAAGAINALIGTAAAVWFWFERRAPNMRLGFGK